MSGRIEAIALAEIGEIGEADPLGALICKAAERTGVALGERDAIVISQKIVSKAEGRVRRLGEVEPGPRALALAADLGKDPRLVELVLGESRRVVRSAGGVLITETNDGWICANAGIDLSNVPGEDSASLLPLDSDASARRIRAEIAARAGVRAAVVIADSFGRPWRVGQTDVAIGCAGVLALEDLRGTDDAHGRELAASAIATADELAGAADLARTKSSGEPVVVIRGAERLWQEADGPGAAASLQRAAEADLFR